MKLAQRSDGSTYDKYALLYTDDTLVISENAEDILRGELGRYFEPKEVSIDLQSCTLCTCEKRGPRQRDECLGSQLIPVCANCHEEY